MMATLYEIRESEGTLLGEVISGDLATLSEHFVQIAIQYVQVCAQRLYICSLLYKERGSNMPRHLWLTSIATVACTGSAFGFTFDGSNWIVNGDFEATAAGYTNNTLEPGFGWMVGSWVNNGCTNSTAEVRTYASVWDFADPSTTLDGWGYKGPSLDTRGNNLLVGGGPVTGTTSNWWVEGLYQSFWIWDNDEAIAKIDAGDLKYKFSGYLGGITVGPWAATQCAASVLMKCTGTYTGSSEVTIGPVSTNNASAGTDYWSTLDYKEASGLIPVGTRRIEVFIFLNHWSDGWSGAGNITDPEYNYSAVDNVVLSVGEPVPEPATMIVLGLGALGVIARRRRRNS
jgi:hypothetical protein